MNVQENIQARFDKKYNCCQVVLTYAAEKLGFNEETALKVASNFGGGMGKGDTCGCVTGALMALGLKYGTTDEEGKKLLNDKKAEFEKRFLDENTYLNCRDLTGYDFSVPGERDKAAEAGVLKETCPKLATCAAKLLDELL